MRKKEDIELEDIYAADIETTYVECENTSYVWSVRLLCMDGKMERFYDLDSFMERIKKFQTKKKIYIHNLKFDGSYFINWLFRHSKHLYNEKLKNFDDIRYAPSNSFSYLISSKGQWYSIKWKTSYTVIEFLDSLKLAPMSLEACAKAFKTEHKKLDLDYSKKRMPGYKPDKEEEAYIDSDVHIMREFLQVYFSEGHTRMTIGSCCLAEFKKIVKASVYDFSELFPNLYEIKLTDGYGSENIGKYILKSYYGAFVYVNPYKAGRVINRKGRTYDVNSEYPYVMTKESGTRFPCGVPFLTKDFSELEKKKEDKICFYRFRTRFRIRKGYIPFIRIRNNKYYNSRDVLSTSELNLDDVLDDGAIDPPEFTMRDEEFTMFKKHYEFSDFEFLDGCYFSELNEDFFDTYIQKYAELKKLSTGGRRTVYKLFLNNLYGKFAASLDSSFKVARLEAGALKFSTIFEENKKEPGYIAIGSAITSAARCYIVKFCQKTWREEKPGFCYCDTDSIHVDSEEDFGLPIHPTELGFFDCEAEWDKAIFLRKKCYIERIETDGVKVSQITCAGANQRCKDLLCLSFGEKMKIKDGCLVSIPEAKTEEEHEFLKVKRGYQDFKVGLKIPGKIMPKQVVGGQHLFTGDFSINDFYYGF